MRPEEWRGVCGSRRRVVRGAAGRGGGRRRRARRRRRQEAQGAARQRRQLRRTVQRDGCRRRQANVAHDGEGSADCRQARSRASKQAHARAGEIRDRQRGGKQARESRAPVESNEHRRGSRGSRGSRGCSEARSLSFHDAARRSRSARKVNASSAEHERRAIVDRHRRPCPMSRFHDRICCHTLHQSSRIEDSGPPSKFNVSDRAVDRSICTRACH